MNVLITGAKGFIGRNLVSQLRNIQSGKVKNYNVSGELNVFEYDVDSDSKSWRTIARKQISFLIWQE